MALAARAFLGALDADQRTTAWYPNLGNQACTTWSNLPVASLPPSRTLARRPD